MAWWTWWPIAFGGFLLLYLAFVALLVVAGRREGARALASFIPDCAVLIGRLLRDGRVPRRHKLLLAALLAYLALPFDLVPDFIPVVGQVDDVLVTVIVLSAFLRQTARNRFGRAGLGPSSHSSWSSGSRSTRSSSFDVRGREIRLEGIVKRFVQRLGWVVALGFSALHEVLQLRAHAEEGGEDALEPPFVALGLHFKHLPAITCLRVCFSYLLLDLRVCGCENLLSVTHNLLRLA